MLKRLRYITGCALIGSVSAGALFGWFNFPFDPHIVGIAIGSLVGVLSLSLQNSQAH